MPAATGWPGGQASCPDLTNQRTWQRRTHCLVPHRVKLFRQAGKRDELCLNAVGAPLPYPALSILPWLHAGPLVDLRTINFADEPDASFPRHLPPLLLPYPFLTPSLRMGGAPNPSFPFPAEEPEERQLYFRTDDNLKPLVSR